uniref:Uncharacterized protein n=1 Tax=Arundo donax TaxID=35708 RepID=A0A0A8YC48_ARUDO
MNLTALPLIPTQMLTEPLVHWLWLERDIDLASWEVVGSFS